MKLVIPKYAINLPINENQISVLTIENPEAFSWVIGDLWKQCRGNMGESILSNKDEIYKMSSRVEMIFNPHAVNCNDRKILSKLYGELKELAQESLGREILEVNSSIVNLLEKVIEQVEYPIEVQYEIDIEGLLKLYDAKINVEFENLLVYLLEYMKIVKRIIKIDIFVVVNLKQFFPEEELNEFYKNLWYEKIYLVILEGYESRACKSYERHVLLDYDLCVIEYE